MEKIAHQLTENVKLLHKVVITADGKVLLLRRSSSAKTRPGKWDLPGGNSEWPVKYDTFANGLHRADIVREIQEETGLTANPDNFSAENLIYFDTTFEPEKQMFTIICGWHWPTNTVKKIKISNEHQEAQWVGWEDIEHYDFGFAQFIPAMIVAAIS